MLLKIKTLSPVHIGSGDRFNSLSYRVVGENIYFYNFDNIRNSLTPEDLMKWSNWITSKIEEMSRLDRQDRERRRQLENELTINRFLNSAEKPSRQNLDNNFLYRLPSYTKTRIYEGYNTNIEAFIMRPDGKPYIPGSEIKGSIRTAVIYSLINQKEYDGVKQYLISEIQQFEKINKQDLDKLKSDVSPSGSFLPRWQSDIKRKLEKRMGSVAEKVTDRLLMSELGSDAKYDLFKTISISDADVNTEENPLAICTIETLGSSRRINLPHQICLDNVDFISGRIQINNNEKFLAEMRFKEPQKRIVQNPPYNLFKCCYDFSERLLCEEISAFKRLNCPYAVKRLEAIQKENKPDSPVIRLGKSEGFLSLTMGLVIKDTDPKLYETVAMSTKGKSYPNIFPKTRRVVDLGDGYESLGWIKLQALKESDIERTTNANLTTKDSKSESNSVGEITGMLASSGYRIKKRS